jgi:hybrid cluster-associated redox disulfide protein
MACGNHDLDLEEVLRRLNAAVGGGAGLARAKAFAIGPDDVIGDVLRTHPSTEPVFRKYYGAACFSCPGQATETVRQSAMMHNAREGELLRELNAAAGLR